MRLKEKNVFCFLALLFLGGSLLAQESLEDLIENEKNVVQVWAEEGAGELPGVFLSGDQRGVEIFSSDAYRANPQRICEPVEPDILLDDIVSPSQNEIFLNLRNVRVRSALGGRCLIRPGDIVLAILQGSQKFVTVKEYFLKRVITRCDNDFPFSLMMTFDPLLEEDPVLFSTDPSLAEGPNQFSRKADLAISGATDDDRKKISNAVPFLEDFSIERIEVSAPNSRALFLLSRTHVSPHDDRLPSSVLLSDNGEDIQTVALERVDMRKGTGRLDLFGTLDFNHDQNIDLVLTITRENCQARLLIPGHESGFSEAVFSSSSCGCPPVR